MELGSTSHWVVAFENSSSAGKAPNADILNFIKTDEGNYSTVKDVDYDQAVIKKKDFVVGPGFEFSIPYLVQSGQSIKLTLFDNDQKLFRQTILDWVYEFLPIKNGQAPVLSKLKDYCLILTVYHFDKQHNSLQKDDSFYVIPDASIAFRGDQEFAADTLPIEFVILGTQ